MTYFYIDAFIIIRKIKNYLFKLNKSQLKTLIKIGY